MKRLLFLSIALLTTAFARSEEPREWIGDIHNQLYIIPKSNEVIFMPHIGVQYNAHALLKPQIHVGIALGEGDPLLSLKASLKAKMKEKDIFYFKSGLMSFVNFAKNVKNRWAVCPHLSGGIEFDGNKYYEIGVLVHPELLKNFGFSINTGIQF